MKVEKANNPVLLLPLDQEEAAIGLWLHGRSKHTQSAYRSDIDRLRNFLGGRPLFGITLADLQGFDSQLVEEGLEVSSRSRVLSAVKSLLKFLFSSGMSPVNVGAAFRLPKKKNTLAQRILDETPIQTMISTEPDKRNRVLLRLLYAAGLRVSELCALQIRDMKKRGKAGQVTVFGKGGKTRAVLVSAETWSELVAITKDQGKDSPIFLSAKGGHLSRVQVWRIVRAAAERCGIDEAVSPHWYRHAHASHALDRGAPIHLVQGTLGHANLATTGQYLHAKPTESSGQYLPI